MKKYHIVLPSLLLCILGGLINCGGKQRSWNTTDQNIVEKSDVNTTDQNVIEKSDVNTTDQNIIEKSDVNTIDQNIIEKSDVNTMEKDYVKTVFDDIKPLFKKHCMLCHGFAEPKINWLDHTTAKSYVDNKNLYEKIWELRNDPVKGMPLGNSMRMTTEEREKIVKWIEDGGLQ